MTESRLIYMPLGGAGEVGMNMYIYGYGLPGQERLIVVDAGVTFSDDATSPGVELITPNFSWLLQRRNQIEAIFITHGHLDHAGALEFLAEELQVPIYVRPLTAEIVLAGIRRNDSFTDEMRTSEPYPSVCSAGPFHCSFLPVSHSIPESSGLVIDTPLGRIIHSGDFKLDVEPVVGEAFDAHMWREASTGQILALACDSTNAMIPETGHSESEVGPNLLYLFSRCRGTIFATTFASNIARLYQMAVAAGECGRKVVLLGRAMNKIVEAVATASILDGLPHVVSLAEARNLPRDGLVVLATGSQGESRAAMARLATGHRFRGITARAGDTVLYSSRTIPGNESRVASTLNGFSRLGVKVITDSRHVYHVSGHPNQPDLTEMHNLVSPELIIPLHGEHRHLAEHARLAEENGFNTVLASNGQMVDIIAGRIVKGESISPGRFYLDGTLFSRSAKFLKARARMAREGSVCVVAMVNKQKSRVRRLRVTSAGLALQDEPAFCQQLAAECCAATGSMRMRRKGAGKHLEATIRTFVHDYCRNSIGKMPVVHLVIVPD